MLVPDLLREQAATAPEHRALVVDGIADLTYGEWEARSNRLARALVNDGVRPGDRVGLIFTNEHAHRFAIAYMAVHKAGAVNVPLNPRLTDAERNALIAHAEPVRILTPDDDSTDGDGSTFQVSIGEDDLADILYTSGTTGLPKGVACTHSNVTFKGSSSMDTMFRGATFLHAIPVYTFAGAHAMTLIPLRAGMTSIVMPRFDASRYLELIREHNVQVSYAVPSMLMLALESPAIANAEFPSLQLLMYGTAPMPPGTIRRLAGVFSNTMLLNLYGLTEGGAAVCLLSPFEATQRPDSLGKPMPPTEVRIVDDAGKPVPAGTPGEIWLRTPVKPRHYFRDDDATNQTWTDDGWVRTGDIGTVDEDGYLYLVDRLKDLIIRGGHNISAPEVEAALLEHDEVREAAVIGIPHQVLGEDTHAFVVCREGAAVAGEELEGFLREKLADFKVPRSYSFVPSLPRNEIGKVLKRELRQQL